jgi:hypothetical protein
LRKIKEPIEQKYDTISWLIRILLGASFNILIIAAFLDFVEINQIYNNGTIYLARLFSTEFLPQTIILVVLIILAPLITSLGLTRKEPELKIVSPLYMSLIESAWIVVYWMHPFSIQNIFFFSYFGIFLVFLGALMDKAVISIVGIAINNKNIFFEKIRAFTEIEKVKARFLVPAIKDSLYLSEKIEGDCENGYIFSTKRGSSYVNKISLTKNKEYPDFCDMKIVYLDKGRYALQQSPDFIEDSKKTSAYLKDNSLE